MIMFVNASECELGSKTQVYINNRCRYQSIRQQYLKRCLIKDDSNYMFRSIVTIIRFSSESMVVLLYRIGMGMSRWWDLSICDVCYMLLLRGTGGGVSVMCAILGCAAQVCLFAAVLCGSSVTVCPYPMSTAGGLLLWFLWNVLFCLFVSCGAAAQWGPWPHHSWGF